MNVKYFAETDTAFFKFSEAEVIETREISENVYADIDSNGNLVSMTIEHARENGVLPGFSYEEISSRSA